MIERVPCFAQRVIAWQKRYGRHDLPWQNTRDPYRIWISEIMLQQTRVETVKAYYERFIKRFPTVAVLARARPKTVLRYFAGLGYYARAHHLHEAARRIMEAGMSFPTHFEQLIALPGIGASTAGAILSLSLDAPHPVLDGNVRRLLTRLYLGADPERNVQETKRLWELARALLPKKNAGVYTQGIMDLGVLRCRPQNPDCVHCPFRRDCRYPKNQRARGEKTGSARSSLPSRRMRLLLIRSGRRLLLESRPPSGIWGGLSCLPEIPPEESTPHWYRKLSASLDGPLKRHPPWRHPLTHLELKIEVYEVKLRKEAEAIFSRPARWVTERGMRSEPLPRPIQRFLENHGNS